MVDGGAGHGRLSFNVDLRRLQFPHMPRAFLVRILPLVCFYLNAAINRRLLLVVWCFLLLCVCSYVFTIIQKADGQSDRPGKQHESTTRLF